MLNKIRKEVHQKLDYRRYESTMVRNQTNCYSHALGSTISCKELYRIGAISGRKSIKEDYISKEEIESLLESDLATLNLQYERFDVSNCKEKAQIIDLIRTYPLQDNEHIVLLWITYFPDKSIRDYHFWRFDENGFSDKRRALYYSKIRDPILSWPESWNCKLNSILRIKR